MSRSGRRGAGIFLANALRRDHEAPGTKLFTFKGLQKENMLENRQVLSGKRTIAQAASLTATVVVSYSCAVCYICSNVRSSTETIIALSNAYQGLDHAFETCIHAVLSIANPT